MKKYNMFYKCKKTKIKIKFNKLKGFFKINKKIVKIIRITIININKLIKKCKIKKTF
jgi:hypothetical protein